MRVWRAQISLLLTLLVLVVVFRAGEINQVGSAQQILEPSATKTDTKTIRDRRGVSLSGTTIEPSVAEVLAEISSQVHAEEPITLTIDEELQSTVYQTLERIAIDAGYAGGAGVIMDIKTGELLTLTSYPAFNEQKELLPSRATKQTFVPGSIVKPFIAIAALTEGMIDPKKKILSTGSLELKDPFRDGVVMVFNDWKAHGYVDMREALGVSSNVYFYTIGGGYGDQPGLGIEKIDEYLSLFGVGQKTGIDLLLESAGRLPSPEWKREEFNDEWRLGDTYLASIGQHGYEVTPLQMARAVAVIASDGELVVPTVIRGGNADAVKIILPIPREHFKVAQEGMLYAVMNGTASGLYMNGATLAAKTGTAEVDSEKKHIHSWIVGYFPYDQPKYAFAFLLDNGPWGQEVGAVSVAHDIFVWMRKEREEYLTDQ